MEFLGFWLTWNGILPINKKVETIVNMAPPNTTKQVHKLIILVKYYRDIWARRSHLIHPLTELTSNRVNFKWTDVEQKEFDDIKCAVAHENLLAYPYFNFFWIFIQMLSINTQEK